MTEEVVVKRLTEAGTEDTGAALKKTRMMVSDAFRVIWQIKRKIYW